MCEQTEINYLDGDVVWVKLGSCWWPGKVVALDKLPPDVLPSFRKPPIAIVKFFQEDTYEYVKNANSIFKYNCGRKNEFINKGLTMYRTKPGNNMDKFPEDVIRAESATDGDIEILTRDEFQEKKKESYADLFGDPVKKTPNSQKKGRGRPGRSMDTPKFSTPQKRVMREKSDYKVHILSQSSKSTEESSTPSTSRAQSEVPEDKTGKQAETETKNPSLPCTPPSSGSGLFPCHACPFTTTRLNVLILHNKTHSNTYIPYTPSPVRKKVVSKGSLKSTPKVAKVQKSRQPRKDKDEKNPKKPKELKRVGTDLEDDINVKKPKTDEEIKSSLLADWDDGEDDEGSNDISSSLALAPSPEVAAAAETPTAPTPGELPTAQVPGEPSLPEKKCDDNNVGEKPESSSDSKYEFCEDEDWPLEKDGGRKIPRVKNASKRKEDSKSIDEDDMAKEVAELLNKTVVPELPSVPEPLKIEENFPEPSIIKSPDKANEKNIGITKLVDKPLETQVTKAIFKTKTFFRSRHSRSQDAIGKYVAEQLNAAERMDLSESELNGSDNVSSPEARDSPPVEQVKVARLAPKIQLKRMKAEAAQLREKDQQKDSSCIGSSSVVADKISLNSESFPDSQQQVTSLQSDVLYPTQEIRPINRECFKNKPPKKIAKSINILENLSGRNSDHKKGNAAVLVDSKITAENKQHDSYMSESTASAVDALLSVSREADRVTKVISDDPPEDLFEDDIKETVNVGNENGMGQNKLEISSELVDSSGIVVEESDQINGSKAEENIELNLEIQSDNLSQAPQELVAQEVPKQVIVNKPLETCETDYVAEKVQTVETISENIPSESDLQIAEALINLPSKALTAPIDSKNNISMSPSFVSEDVQEETVCTSSNVELDNETNFVEEKKTENVESSSLSLLLPKNENVNARFETEEEKSENLNAAESLVQMSKSIDHKIIVESSLVTEESAVAENEKSFSKTMDKNEENFKKINNLSPGEETSKPKDGNSASNGINTQFDNSTSKLLKILEEPVPSRSPTSKVVKQMIVTGKEKILNFDVSSSPIKPKGQSPKQKIIIRRATASKNVINLNEVTASEKIILSRTNKTGSDSIQTYTIQASPDTTTDANKIIIQPKIRKITKTPTKQLKKDIISNVSSSIVDVGKVETSIADDSIFDINSMPIVLSDDILTPENIEKMPIVMSDGNVITNPVSPMVSSTTSKIIKTKQILHTEKVTISPLPVKPEVKQKTIIMNQTQEVSKATTPNILSKSSKLRATKPMLVIDKSTGKQKFIMTKTDTAIKEIKQAPAKIQPVPQTTGKSEKFIILPSPCSPRPTRTQKIVIDPQTGKAHVLVSKGPETPVPVENKPVAAKLIPSQGDASSPGNTVMIITNAQGAQSRIVLTPEHEKILFPNKQQANVSQLKTLVQSSRVTNSAPVVKTVMTTCAPTRNHTKIVPKQKSAIITSKGQLIVGGRVATSVQNIAPMPEVRQATTEVRTIPKRIIASEPKKLVQTIQKNSSEPLIFLQQKSGTVMQLTAAQFEHLQRTGKIVQKPPIQESKKIIVQKSITIPAKDTSVLHKPTKKVRKTTLDQVTPAKKVKHDTSGIPMLSSGLGAQSPGNSILASPASFVALTTTSCPGLAIASAPVPSLAPLSHSVPSAPSSSYSELDNLEELLPSTAIVRQQEPPPPPPLVHEEVSAPLPTTQDTPADPPGEAALADGQLLAVPGENFGGPPGTFYLCFEDAGTLTPIDNRPLVLENNQLVPMVEPAAPERRDILEAALANSDVFHAEVPYRDPTPLLPAAGVVSETSTTLHQPIMTPVEVPSKAEGEPAVPHSIEDGLAVIGVTPGAVPTSLELPITVTDPRIALLGTDAVGKSMPLLTDEAAEASSAGSPGSLEDAQWVRRLLTPTSDVSDASAELPLQPTLRLSLPDLSRPV